MRNLLLYLVSIAVASLLLIHCSVQQNNITSSIYHNVTAHYNGYYYAREKIQEIETSILESVDDDYNQIPRLYPKLDTTFTIKYAENANEAIKMASLSIQRHPNSKWVYPNYTMVGLARLYTHDLQNAIQTFKYINTKSQDPNIQNSALIYLSHALLENEEYDRAKEVFQFVEKRNVNRKNQKKLYLEKAYYYQQIRNYPQMVQNLVAADMPFTKKEGKGRLYLIAGQVYQKIGSNPEAYTYYKKCVASNPPYKIDLYARLGLLQTTPLINEKVIKKVNKKFDKALKDDKNIDFKNKIYYEIAELRKKQGQLQEAITNYQFSTHASGDDIVKGYSFLKLGQLYFDSLKEYTVSKKYYDSTILFLPKDVENYKQIERQQKTLAELVENMNTITWQDSLLHMASIDSASLRKQLESTLQKREERKKEREEQQKKAVESNKQNNISFQNRANTSPEWYFENPSIVSIGKSDFQQTWGNIALEDHWRRSDKISIAPLSPENEVAIEKEKKPIDTPDVQKDGNNSIDKVLDQLPVTEEAKRKSFAKIEDAYFNIGEIFQFRLNKREDAIKAYDAILKRFPQSKRVPEALYKSYKVAFEKNPQQAENYYQQLVSNYPNSDFTKTLLNPDYQKEKRTIFEKQNQIYKIAYTDFEHGRIREAQEKINTALQLGQTKFTPQLEILDILITGKVEPLAKYQSRLKSFLKKYPDKPLNPYAKTLLASSEALQKKEENLNSIRYKKSFDESHYLAIVYIQQDSVPKLLSGVLSALAQKESINPKPNITYRVLDDQHMITLMSEFPDAKSALYLLQKFNTNRLKSVALSKYALSTFVITKTNATTLQRTKALEEYLAFFDKNYKDKIHNLPK